MTGTRSRVVVFVLLIFATGITGCDAEEEDAFGSTNVLAPQNASGKEAPPGLVTVNLGGSDIHLWPYSGRSFDGVPVDPLNLVFVGIEPVSIRAALLALDGNRPGLPAEFPFNVPWKEAIGDVQTGYSDRGGWAGSIIQLQLGAYDPVRFHLRLFRAGELPDGRVITLGAAHFELLVPNTSEHQVLSWELAEELVAYDMARTGLLVSSPQPTGSIHASPSYREIPDFIYNLLPSDLLAVLGGPPSPVSAPVPLPSDGTATILTLDGSGELTAGRLTQTLAIEFNQVVPKPFCADGPFDWVLITGPVQFRRDGETDASGRYTYRAHYEGLLVVTPVDITRSPPVPVGEPFSARVQGEQNGFIWADASRVQARDMRLAPQDGGMELLNTLLRVSTQGGSEYREHTKCMEP